MLALRAAFTRLLQEVGAGERAAEIAAKLEIDPKLAWRAVSIISIDQPLLAAEHLPGDEGVEILIRAARRRGASEPAALQLRAAIEAFKMLQREHADDRQTFEAMLASLAGDGPDSFRTQLAARKSAFKANAAIFGVYARVQFRCDFVHASSKPGKLDFAALRGWIGLVRLRPGANWMFLRAKAYDSSISGIRSAPFENGALDPEAYHHLHAPLIPRFCSTPIPRFRQSTDERGMVNTYIHEGPIGLGGALNLVTGEFARGVGSPVGSADDPFGECGDRLSTPVELFIHDLLIDRSIWGRVEPELIMFPENCVAPPHPSGERDKPRLPVPERVQHIGRGLIAAHVPEIPSYSEMASLACERLGWIGDDFDLYRVRMPFPPIITSPCIRHRLPLA
jgi:hypothetical protein